jgi:hypothetical protein
MQSCELLRQTSRFVRLIHNTLTGRRNIPSGSIVANSIMQLRHSLAMPMASSRARLSPIAAPQCRRVASTVSGCGILGSLRCQQQQLQLQARRCSALAAAVRGEPAAVGSCLMKDVVFFLCDCEMCISPAACGCCCSSTSIQQWPGWCVRLTRAAVHPFFHLRLCFIENYGTCKLQKATN